MYISGGHLLLLFYMVSYLILFLRFFSICFLKLVVHMLKEGLFKVLLHINLIFNTSKYKQVYIIQEFIKAFVFLCIFCYF